MEQRRLAAIIFTDAGERHRAELEAAAERFRGRLLRAAEGSFLLAFAGALDAVQCARQLQLLARQSLHVGEIVEESGAAYGEAVSVAAAVLDETPSGGIALTREIYAQVKQRLPYSLESLGSRSLEGLSEPQEIFLFPPRSQGAAAPALQAAALKVVVPAERPAEAEVAALPPPVAESVPLSSRLPPPPPALPARGAGMSPLARLAGAAAFFLFFGRSWTGATAADWLGAGTTAAAVLCWLALRDGPPLPRRAAGALLLALASAAFLQPAFASGRSLAGASVDVLVAAGVSAMTGLSGLFLAFWGGRGERRLGCLLLAVSAGAWLITGAAAGLPEAVSWSQGVPDALHDYASALRASGGAKRWAGVAVLFAGYATWRTSG